MPVISRNGNYIISSDFGTRTDEGTRAGGDGPGRTITFAVSQIRPEYLSGFAKIVPVTGETGDFWDSFWSNRPGGEPADEFALSGFLSLDGESVSFQVNADHLAEGNETFEFRLYESPIDEDFGIPPLATARFTIVDDDIVLRGSPLADTLRGGDSSERILGLAGRDTLSGGLGNDTLDGGPGADRTAGGAGNDVHVIDNAGDLVIEAAGGGRDLVRASVSHVLAANVEDLTQTGSAGLRGTGNGLANRLTGNGGANMLDGGLGQDSLAGGAGADRLVGGAGRDVLTGGVGADQFVFRAAADSGLGVQHRDLVTDFRHAQGDRINLAGIDADSTLAGDQRFHLVGERGYSHDAGELRVQIGGGLTVVLGDVDGDGRADFSVAIHGQVGLGAGDFIL